MKLTRRQKQIIGGVIVAIIAAVAAWFGIDLGGDGTSVTPDETETINE